MTVEYNDSLRIFNDTVANMSIAEDVQRLDTIKEITAMQAQSMDPSDMGAYNLTMYGINQVHDAKTHIFNTVGNVNNYQLPGVAPTPLATALPLQTEHTGISASLTSGLTGGTDGLFSHIFTDPSSVMPTQHPTLWLIYGAFGLLLGKFLIFRR